MNHEYSITNADLALQVLTFLKEVSVKNIIVCAGARNLPFLKILDNDSFRLISYFEERSAAFYALGLTQSSEHPVAIITTSGTAAAELLPAVIEAYYQSKSIIVITADRPKKYRGSGAPQAIIQADLFKNYVFRSYDWDRFEDNFKIEYFAKCPLHLNICFDEPLVDSITDQESKINLQVVKYLSASEKSQVVQSLINPLVIIGQLENAASLKAKKWLIDHKILHYAESLSGLLNDSDLKEYQLNILENKVSHLFENKIFQSVVRIGSVPTLKFWRELENKFKSVFVVSLTDSEFTGLARSSVVLRFDQLENLKLEIQNDQENLKIKIKNNLQFLKNSLGLNPNSEQNFINLLSHFVNEKPLYLGNSLPIREWDLFSESFHSLIYANRGANGIDGQLSTYIGWSNGLLNQTTPKRKAHDFESWALVGDLTALYDLAALGLAVKLKGLRIVVMNNNGGQIFKKIFKNTTFLNSQNIHFKSFAEMWGWNYLQISTASAFEKLKNLKSDLNYIIELNPDQSESDKVWIDYENLQI